MNSQAISTTSRPLVAVIGARFCGLATACELGKHGAHTTVLECDGGVGGLAGSFLVGGTRLERFYHHWFTNDVHVMRLIKELGQANRVLRRPYALACTTPTTSSNSRHRSTSYASRRCRCATASGSGCWRGACRTGTTSKTGRPRTDCGNWSASACTESYGNLSCNGGSAP